MVHGRTYRHTTIRDGRIVRYLSPPTWIVVPRVVRPLKKMPKSHKSITNNPYHSPPTWIVVRRAVRPWTIFGNVANTSLPYARLYHYSCRHGGTTSWQCPSVKIGYARFIARLYHYSCRGAGTEKTNMSNPIFGHTSYTRLYTPRKFRMETRFFKVPDILGSRTLPKIGVPIRNYSIVHRPGMNRAHH